MNENKVEKLDESARNNKGDLQNETDDVYQSMDKSRSTASEDTSDEDSEATDQHVTENTDYIDRNHNSQFAERPKRKSAGAGVDRLEMRFNGKKYPDLTMKQFLQVTKKASQNSLETFFKKCVDIVFTQMNAKKGFKKYGEIAVSAVIKEF